MDFEIIKKALRIITIAKKPDNEEFLKIAKITSIGMIIIGVIGFIILLIFEYL
ncbi:MAG: protein translocase SEC61 complex subunit gamma [Candidatus Micrarchaeota archaeon]